MGVKVKLVRSYEVICFIAGMFRRCTWVFFRWLSCSIKDIMAFQGCNMFSTSQSHPPLPVCFLNFHLPSMMSWVIGMNDAVFMFLYPKSSRT